MSIRELAEQLTLILELEADSFDAIEQAMRADRQAFVALRTSELEARLPGLLDLAEQALGLARRREQLQQSLGTRLGNRNLTLSSLLPHVPRDLRPRLELAAERARRSSGKVRIESRVGERLLGLSRRWRESLVGVSIKPDKREATVYDHRARAARTTGGSGSVVRGTI